MFVFWRATAFLLGTPIFKAQRNYCRNAKYLGGMTPWPPTWLRLWLHCYADTTMAVPEPCLKKLISCEKYREL